MNTTMAMAVVSSSISFTTSSPFHLPRIEVKSSKLPRLNFSAWSQAVLNSQEDGRGRRKVWRRRKLTKKDDYLDAKIIEVERVPFLEEKVRQLREEGEVMTVDIERLLLSEENRYDFVNEVAAEAKLLVERNRDEYGVKKAVHHALSNRMNEAGIYRPEAYMDPDPYKRGGPTIPREGRCITRR